MRHYTQRGHIQQIWINSRINLFSFLIKLFVDNTDMCVLLDLFFSCLTGWTHTQTFTQPENGKMKFLCKFIWHRAIGIFYHIFLLDFFYIRIHKICNLNRDGCVNLRSSAILTSNPTQTLVWTWIVSFIKRTSETKQKVWRSILLLIVFKLKYML